MDATSKQAAIETLARVAAECAGRNPDEHLRISLGGVVVHEGPTWNYIDFVERAEAALHILASPFPPVGQRSPV